jgi:hydrocephalus-inducing protein
MINLQIKAFVTMPAIETSSNFLDFRNIECGNCKVISVQLYNPLEVDAVWKYLPTFDKRLELDKHLPMHLVKKLKKDMKPLPRIFEIMPTDGVLTPKVCYLQHVTFLLPIQFLLELTCINHYIWV